ncbi:hypothetical protein DOY81_009323, partial [Sarcophaga bullata]
MCLALRVGHAISGANGDEAQSLGIIILSARNKISLFNRTHKRVAEVWMDDYRIYFYELNSQFLDEIAPDLLVNYPPREKESFAYGAIQFGWVLFNCADNKTHPHSNQNWIFTNIVEVNSTEIRIFACMSTVLNANAKQGVINFGGAIDADSSGWVHGKAGINCLEPWSEM